MSDQSTADGLRYPIGPMIIPASVTPAERAAHLESIRTLPQRLRAALAGLSEDQLERPYRPGGWTIRQTVHHLADSHMNSYIRFKLAATEERPTVRPYDQDAWAELRDGKSAPIELSLQLLDALHTRWSIFLDSLEEADWARVFVHPAMGDVRLDAAASLYAWHSDHHLAHIVNVRQREGF